MHTRFLAALLAVACDSNTTDPTSQMPTQIEHSSADETTIHMHGDSSETSNDETTDDLSSSSDARDTDTDTNADTGHDNMSTSGTASSDGDGESTGGECVPLIDIVLSIDVSIGMMWPLQRLAYDLPAMDALLKAQHGADVRWVVLPWVDVLGPVHEAEDSGDWLAAGVAGVAYWAEFGIGNHQPDGSEETNDEPADAGLVALVAAAATEWRADATRVVVHVTDSSLAEAPAVLSGHGVSVTYADTVAALGAAGVHVVAWAPAGEPGYAAPWNDSPAVASVAYDIAVENMTAPPPAPGPDPLFAEHVAEYVATLEIDCGGLDTTSG